MFLFFPSLLLWDKQSDRYELNEINFKNHEFPVQPGNLKSGYQKTRELDENV